MEEKKNLKLVIKPQSGDSQLPILGIPQELKAGIYGIKTAKAEVGRIYSIPCPNCDHQRIIKAKAPGVFKVVCRSCKTVVIYKASKKEDILEAKKTEESVDSQRIEVEPVNGKETERVIISKHKSNGKLIWGGLLKRKTYVLHEGANYIGRDDKDLPSDVSIKDDYASRRSVKIEVVPDIKGNSFKLTVENATNPILVNGKSQVKGDCVFLNFDDTIVLGNTTIIFKEIKL